MSTINVTMVIEQNAFNAAIDIRIKEKTEFTVVDHVQQSTIAPGREGRERDP